ncbi:collagen binding domain-containing protein [Paenibacillus sp. FSL K6-1318]|uniref:collagen binding domain-containing protein n=1 Tax=Paenibacillus sp. FSL K6-1318 TaxID=2975291 RepID=UPI0030EB7427
MEWTQNNEPRSAETDARFWPDNLTKDNGAKRGTYNASNKEITWDILMNYNKKSWSQTEVRDVLQQGQKVVPDSVKVYDMTLSGTWNGASKGAEVPSDRYTVIAPSQENGNELRIQFADNVSTPYWITFRTSLESELLTSQVKNKAIVQSSGTTVAEWNATVTIPHGGVYITKNGAQNGNKIDWKLNINEGQSYVSDARIIDEPSANQILMGDSFHLYSTKVTAEGDISKDQELIRDRDYTLNIHKDGEGKQRFELKFVEAISSAYILEYQSFIHAGDKSKVSNKVRMEGNRLTTEKRETQQQITVRTSSGSGTGSGVTGSLEVTKVDKEQPDKMLEGATFALYDKAEKRTPIIQTTDADGKIVFNNLLYDDYVLEELTAPEGYDVDQARISIKIDSGVKKTGNVKPIVVTNTKKTVPPTEPGTPADPDPQTPTEPGTPADPDPQTPIETVVPGSPVPVASVPVIIEDEDIPLGGVDPNPTPSDEETPGSEEPAIPSTPVEPSQPPVVINDDPIPQGIPVGEPQPQQPDGGGTQTGMLPQTGENSKMPFYVSGIILLLLGSSLLFRRKV